MFSFRAIFKYIWLLVKPYKLGFFSMFGILFFRIIFGLILVPYGYKSIVDVLSLDNVDITTRANIALSYLIFISFCFVGSILCSRYRDLLNLRLESSVIRDIYNFSFFKLSNHSYKFFTEHFVGSLVAKVKRFVRAYETISFTVIHTFWIIIILVISSTVTLYFQSKILAFYLIIWSLIYGICVLFLVKKRIKLDLKEAEADSRISGTLADSMTNITNVKIFSALEKEFKYFQGFSNALRERIYASQRFGIFNSSIQAVLMIIFHIFMIYTMISLWQKGEISLGVFTMAYVFIFTILDRIWELADGISRFMKAMTDMKEVVDIFEKDIDIKDKPDPEKSRMKEGVIEFKNVSFRYVEENAVFENFNLKINKGEKVGLVGHSGSGKSTITKLLLRFADVASGEILIDGQNIASVTQNDLRDMISYVPQESILFHRPIKENINYGKPTASIEEIVGVAKKAHADEFIRSMPKGYDTLVGERGVKLSGGERQRIAIARAMLKDSPILVLDEATSSLDSISESYIQDAFNELMKGKTSIVIAHRLSTVQKMDRIIVLEKGKIVEEGTHKELLDKKGFYADLWDHQTGGFLE